MSGLRKRRSIRLKDYLYVEAGAYFVTICTYNRDCLFGDVVDGKMRLNKYGEIARQEWISPSSLRPNVLIDTFVIMPNHLHGIIILTNDQGFVRKGEALPHPYVNTGRLRPGSIGAIIAQFKSVTAKRINVGRGLPGYPVWQRNYYERVLRENELDPVRLYIENNPAQWEMDIENPAGRPTTTSS